MLLLSVLLGLASSQHSYRRQMPPFSFAPEAGCRPDNTSTLCSNRGDCTYGMCDCYPRENGEEVVSGAYCQCDNFSCDRYNGELCSGPGHGECVCGNCECHSEWQVEGYTACECEASNESCITPFGEHMDNMCSSHGTCECGECRCEETEDGRYSGRWCEECPTCPPKCEELKPCVQCQVFQSGELLHSEDGRGGFTCTDEAGEPRCTFASIVVAETTTVVAGEGRRCTFVDDDDCRFTFAYGNKAGEFQVCVIPPLIPHFARRN